MWMGLLGVFLVINKNTVFWGWVSFWHMIKNRPQLKTTNIDSTSEWAWKLSISDICGFDQRCRHDQPPPQKYLKSMSGLVRSNTSEKPKTKSFLRSGVASRHMIKNRQRAKTGNMCIILERSWKWRIAIFAVLTNGVCMTNHPQKYF